MTPPAPDLKVLFFGFILDFVRISKAVFEISDTKLWGSMLSVSLRVANRSAISGNFKVSTSVRLSWLLR